MKVPVTFPAQNQTLLKSKCVVPENIHTPHPPRRETEIRRGGGVQNEAISEGWGWLRVRLVSYLKLTAVLLSTLSVTLLFIGVSKQKLLFSSMILYLRPAECFFHGLHDSLCNTIVVRSLINLVIYLLLCYTIYCGIHLPRIQTSLSPFRFISSRWPLPC